MAPTPVDEAFLRPVAEGLVDGTSAGAVSVRAPFTLGLIPRGIGLVLDDLPRRKGVQIAVGPRSGSLVHDPDGPVSRVEVPLDARHLLVVGAPPGKPLSDEELVTFTAGITVSLAGR